LIPAFLFFLDFSKAETHMESSAPWWQTLFEGDLFQESMRHWMSPEQTRADADFLEQTLKPGKGDRIADIPCGAGRLSLELARRGYNVTGVDLCAGLLLDARRGAQAEGLPASFEKRDMRDLPWPAAFHHAFCFGNSFAYFDDAGNRAYLKAVHGILKPGGIFILETALAAEGVLAQQFQRRWYSLGNLYCLHETRYEPETGRLISSYKLIQDGRMETAQAVYQVYTFRELVRMIQEAGFELLESFGSLSKEPFRLGSPDLLLVCRRP
jgi:ubiquinone/menaquinone biosynthesis C-methylase UbiE